MKHTDFYNQIEAIKRKEQRELIEALKAHGGSYSWYNEDIQEFESEYPCVAVNLNGINPNPMDVDIRSISINKYDDLCFKGEDKEWGNEVRFFADDVFAGHIAYIIDMIPETDTVNDVTSREEAFIIASVCRDDLVNEGFDAENLSDEDLQCIANIMGDFYDNYGYRDDLLEAARKLGLKKFNNK